MCFFQKVGGISEGTRPFPLKIFDTKISFNSTSGECIIVRMQSWPSYSLPQVTVYKSYQFRFKQSTCWSLPQQHQRRILPWSFYQQSYRHPFTLPGSWWRSCGQYPPSAHLNLLILTLQIEVRMINSIINYWNCFIPKYWKV